ncbi:(2Fe-2S)-binding protein [Methylomonas sp. BW4-1]|uniref:(2Fe-2S)-binding protein n=1 Tax=Methylomonas sp. BW4-1 TaxID=3376685 RepID=UPI0040421616
MNAIKPDTENEVICYCSGTTVQQIKALLIEGVVEPARISRITGTASGCGGCEFEFHRLVSEHNQEA